MEIKIGYKCAQKEQCLNWLQMIKAGLIIASSDNPMNSPLESLEIAIDAGKMMKFAQSGMERIKTQKKGNACRHCPLNNALKGSLGGIQA